MANTLATGTSNRYMFRSNPVLRKLSKIEETDQDNCCTYAGIKAKLIYFMVMVLVGIVAALAIRKMGLASTTAFEDEGVALSMMEIIAIAIAGIGFVLTMLLAFLIKVTIPVTGALFCACSGYVISWAALVFGPEYAELVMMALGITVLVIMSLGFLYFTGKVRVDKKFRTVLTTLIITSVLASLLMFIGYLIPATRSFVVAIEGNSVIYIASSIIMVIIASLFLLVDFDTVRRSVDDELPKKYEWWAAFGLAFSVIWLFFKILELLSKIKGNKK